MINYSRDWHKGTGTKALEQRQQHSMKKIVKKKKIMQKMIKNNIPALTIITFCIILTNSCGQHGSLYLPNKNPKIDRI